MRWRGQLGKSILPESPLASEMNRFVLIAEHFLCPVDCRRKNGHHAVGDETYGYSQLEGLGIKGMVSLVFGRLAV